MLRYIQLTNFILFQLKTFVILHQSFIKYDVDDKRKKKMLTS